MTTSDPAIPPLGESPKPTYPKASTCTCVEKTKSMRLDESPCWCTSGKTSGYSKRRIWRNKTTLFAWNIVTLPEIPTSKVMITVVSSGVQNNQYLPSSSSSAANSKSSHGVPDRLCSSERCPLCCLILRTYTEEKAPTSGEIPCLRGTAHAIPMIHKNWKKRMSLLFVTDKGKLCFQFYMTQWLFLVSGKTACWKELTS